MSRGGNKGKKKEVRQHPITTVWVFVIHLIYFEFANKKNLPFEEYLAFALHLLPVASLAEKGVKNVSVGKHKSDLNDVTPIHHTSAPLFFILSQTEINSEIKKKKKS